MKCTMKMVIVLNLGNMIGIMKKILFLTVAVVLLMPSCTEDKGTYDYTPLNEVLISGIEKSYIALNEAPFSISPTVKQELGADENSLKYLWYAYNSNSQQYSADTLAFTKNLALDKLMLAPKDYTLVFKVTDTSSDIFYNYTSRVDVKGFSDGLQVLSDNNGNAQLSILRGKGANNFEAYKDRNNNEIAGKNPVGITGINESMRAGKPHRYAILCNDETLGAYVGGADFIKTINISDAFTKIPKPNVVKGVVPIYKDAYVTGIYGGNGVYTTFQPEGPYGAECSFRYYFDHLSPDFCVGGFSGFTFFDTATTGFGKTDSWGTSFTLYLASDKEDQAFDITNTGLSVIYGKAVSNYGMGLFVDDASKQKYILALSGTDAAFKKEVNGTDLNDATAFEFFNTKQILLYAFNNTIYTYDIVANKVLYTYELSASAIINHMEVAGDDNKLFVGFGNGTNESKSGSVHILNVDLDGEILGIHEAYDNICGKVVDFYENY